MAEQVTLPAPITKPSLTKWALDRVTIDVTVKSIYIQWLGDTGEAGSAVYSTPPPADHASQPAGSALLTTLNKANFAGGNASMVKAIFNRLIADGYIAGTVSGTPD